MDIPLSSPASGDQDATQEARLVKWTPVEPGWVVAYPYPRDESDSETYLSVLPVSGWADWEVTDPDGSIWFDSIPQADPWQDYDPTRPYVRFSRTVFREAQSGYMEISLRAFKARVSE